MLQYMRYTPAGPLASTAERAMDIMVWYAGSHDKVSAPDSLAVSSSRHRSTTIESKDTSDTGGRHRGTL